MHPFQMKNFSRRGNTSTKFGKATGSVTQSDRAR